VRQVGDQSRLYYDAQSTNHQDSNFIAVISKLCTVLLLTQANNLWLSFQTCVRKAWFYCVHSLPCTQLHAAWSCKMFINFYSLHSITFNMVDVVILHYICTINSKLSARKSLTLHYPLHLIRNHIHWKHLLCSKII